jgi:hypothetical protein
MCLPAGDVLNEPVDLMLLKKSTIGWDFPLKYIGWDYFL